MCEPVFDVWLPVAQVECGLLHAESDGRSGGLDTLPEGKLADSQTQFPQATMTASQVGSGLQDPGPNSHYKRVYPDWKPAIDKTDVVGTMEAIAGAIFLSPSIFLSIYF